MATISCPQNHIRFISDSGIGSVREISAAAFTRTQNTHSHSCTGRSVTSGSHFSRGGYQFQIHSWREQLIHTVWRHVSRSRSQLIRRDTVHNKIWHWSPTMKPLSQGSILFKRREASINQTRRAGKTVSSKNNGLLYGPYSHEATCIGKSAVSDLITYTPGMEMQQRSIERFPDIDYFYVLFSSNIVWIMHIKRS